MQVSIDNDELEKKVAIALKGINGRSLAQAILKCMGSNGWRSGIRFDTRRRNCSRS